jgi:glyoxylase-like metal-dependent hydrolase (beta-lactamase superfamily II)
VAKGSQADPAKTKPPARSNSDAFRAAEWLLAPQTERPADVDPAAALAELKAARDGATAARFGALERALAGADTNGARGAGATSYVARYGLAGVYEHVTSGGTHLWQIRVETYPGHVNNVYLLKGPRGNLLWDAGSNQPSSARDLDAGFAAVRGFWKHDATLDGVKAIAISHGHVDHFSGAPDLVDLSRTKAPLFIHEADREVLTDPKARYERHVTEMVKFLADAEIPQKIRDEIVPLYAANKQYCRPTTVARGLRDGDAIGEEVGASWPVIHTPGHCPGHLCLRVDDTLLTGDHVLARISPHQGPGFLTPGCGLHLFFESLERVKAIPGIRRALPGHQEPVENLPQRVDEIRAHHELRFEKISALGTTPGTTWDMTDRLYAGRLRGYDRLLGALETAAHLEWLEAHGRFKRDGARTRRV